MNPRNAIEVLTRMLNELPFHEDEEKALHVAIIALTEKADRGKL